MSPGGSGVYGAVRLPRQRGPCKRYCSSGSHYWLVSGAHVSIHSALRPDSPCHTGENRTENPLIPGSASWVFYMATDWYISLASSTTVETSEDHYAPRSSGSPRCHTSRGISRCPGRYPSCSRVCSWTRRCQGLRLTSPETESKTVEKERVRGGGSLEPHAD